MYRSRKACYEWWSIKFEVAVHAVYANCKFNLPETAIATSDKRLRFLGSEAIALKTEHVVTGRCINITARRCRPSPFPSLHSKPTLGGGEHLCRGKNPFLANPRLLVKDVLIRLKAFHLPTADTVVRPHQPNRHHGSVLYLDETTQFFRSADLLPGYKPAGGFRWLGGNVIKQRIKKV